MSIPGFRLLPQNTIPRPLDLTIEMESSAPDAAQAAALAAAQKTITTLTQTVAALTFTPKLVSFLSDNNKTGVTGSIFRSTGILPPGASGPFVRVTVDQFLVDPTKSWDGTKSVFITTSDATVVSLGDFGIGSPLTTTSIVPTSGAQSVDFPLFANKAGTVTLTITMVGYANISVSVTVSTVARAIAQTSRQSFGWYGTVVAHLIGSSGSTVGAFSFQGPFSGTQPFAPISGVLTGLPTTFDFQAYLNYYYAAINSLSPGAWGTTTSLKCRGLTMNIINLLQQRWQDVFAWTTAMSAGAVDFSVQLNDGPARPFPISVNANYYVQDLHNAFGNTDYTSGTTITFTLKLTNALSGESGLSIYSQAWNLS